MKEIIAKSRHGNVSVMVSDEDYEYLSRYKWSYNKKFCVSAKDSGHSVIMHRLIMQPSTDEVVDHINRDVLDNRRENLRVCTRQQNNCNNGKEPGLSGYRGVSKHGLSGWRAQISHNYKYINIGTFDTPEEAAIAWNKKAVELRGSFAILNTLRV